MSALPLFALARKTDPATSHKAAQTMNETGATAIQAMRCLNAVQRWPDKTAAELAQLAGIPGMDRYAFNRRLSDLRDNGHVVKGARRACAVLGSECLTWRVK